MHKKILYFFPWLIISSVVTLPRPSIAIAAETKPTTVQIAQGPDGSTFNEENVRQMTVKVSTAKNQGSGTLIGQQGDIYLVLTSSHVLNGETTIQIQTHDGQNYTAQVAPNAFREGYDLALVKFQSSHSYQLAEISTATPRESLQLFTGGYAAESGTFQGERGTLEQMRSQPLQEGYQLGYSGDVPQGTSGGPIFDVTGQLVGIQGRSKFSLVDEYVNQDGPAIPAAEIEKLRQRNWGIPIRTVLAQIEQPLLVAYDLPLPKTEIGITRPNWTGWTAELEAKAKGFTVLIENTTENKNGSGVIIAKQGNTYTVLTSEHNFREEEGVSARFTLTTHDGQTHTLNKSKFRLEPGVDLAVVEFESQAEYPVAKLAKYSLKTEDKVFVAGFPKFGPDNSQLLMNGGMLYEQEQGRLQITESNVHSNQQVNEFAQATPSTAFYLGYDLLYTSITYGGMSGGPVLDHQGQVIGIHGLAESENETNFSEQRKTSLPIQLGNSLGIPIHTFLGLASKMKVNLESITIQQTTPTALTSQQIDEFRKSLLSVKIPSGNAKPEALIERGNQLRRIGLYQQAVEAFDKAIALNRGNEHLAYFGKAQTIGESLILGMALEEIKKELEPMEEALKQSVQLNPEYSTAWRALATHYRTLAQLEVGLRNNIQAASNYGQALHSINQAIVTQKGNTRFFNANLYNDKFVILTELRRYKEALVAINTALRLSPRASFYSNRGVAYAELKRYEEAIKDYNQAIKLNPKYVDVYINRGVAYARLKRYEEAIKDYSQAAQLNSRHEVIFDNRGRIYSILKRYEEAIKDYSQAIKLNPKYVPAFYNRGLTYFRQNRYEEAIKDYNQAINILPGFMAPYASRAIIFAKKNNHEEAIKDYTKVIAVHPNIALTYYNRGRSYKALNRNLEAIKDYTQAISINPQLIDAYYKRGDIYKELKKHVQARDDYSQVIRLRPASPLTYFKRGSTNFALKNYEQSIADYSQTIKLMPDFALAYSIRGTVYKEMGNTTQAKRDIKASAKLFKQQSNLKMYMYMIEILEEL